MQTTDLANHRFGRNTRECQMDILRIFVPCKAQAHPAQTKNLRGRDSRVRTDLRDTLPSNPLIDIVTSAEHFMSHQRVSGFPGLADISHVAIRIHSDRAQTKG